MAKPSQSHSKKAKIKAKVTFTYDDGSPQDDYDVLDYLSSPERLVAMFICDGCRYEVFIPAKAIKPRRLAPFQATFTKDGKANPRDGITDIKVWDVDGQHVIFGTWVEDGGPSHMRLAVPEQTKWKHTYPKT